LVLPVTLKLQLPGWDHPSGLWPVSGRPSHLQASDGKDRSAIGRRCCPCSAAHDGCVTRPRVCFYPGFMMTSGFGQVGSCRWGVVRSPAAAHDGAVLNVGEEGQGRSA
jgi:hypothetical protein